MTLWGSPNRHVLRYAYAHPDVYPESAQTESTAVNNRSSPERGQTSSGNLNHRCRAAPVADVLKSQAMAVAEPQPPANKEGLCWVSGLYWALKEETRQGREFLGKGTSGQASTRRRCGPLWELKGHLVRWKASWALGTSRKDFVQDSMRSGSYFKRVLEEGQLEAVAVVQMGCCIRLL